MVGFLCFYCFSFDLYSVSKVKFICHFLYLRKIFRFNRNTCITCNQNQKLVNNYKTL